MKITTGSGRDRLFFTISMLRKKIMSTMRMGRTLAKNKLVRPGQILTDQCPHLDQIQAVTPSAAGCTDCLKTGDRWVHLRICLICGYVGCCNDSKNKHATRHFHTTNHPLMQSFEPGESWVWCYLDQTVMEP
jgi:uncharacterized UBP type Zn finger protein